MIIISNVALAQNVKVRIDTTPVERFYRLMEHIEKQKGSKLGTRYGSVEQLRDSYSRNIKDSARQQLIHSLLETRPYSHQYMNYVRMWKYQAQEAYRVAYNMIGDHCPRMTADMPRSWIKYWNNPRRPDLESINKIVNSVEIKDSLVLSLLPRNGINDSLSMVLYYTVDGNRGGYEEENIMVLDLVGTSPMRAMRQDNVISHEMHHIYYEDWLRRDITTAPKDSALREFQIAFVKEGIAQYLTYPDYSKPIKQLYANKKLLQELLTDLENGVNLETDNYKLDIKRLWKYLPFAAIGNYQHRPNIIYYLSLNVYQSIEKAGGREMLQYVIENPTELINTYNRLYDAKIMNFKPFSDSFAKRWSNNMQ